MPKETKGNYIFPSIMAKAMKSVSQRTQYEAELMSLSFILVGIMVMSFLAVFYTELSFWLKFMTVFNAFAAFILLSSRLITSFQQYQNYLLMVGLIKEHQFENPTEDKSLHDNAMQDNSIQNKSNIQNERGCPKDNGEKEENKS